MKKGFTMIELIFVIVILGILASVAVPRLASTREDAEISATVANLRTLISDASAYYVAKGHFNDAKWRDFTNVPLRTVTNTDGKTSSALIEGSTETTTATYISASGTNCIKIEVKNRVTAEDGKITPAHIAITKEGTSDYICQEIHKAEPVKAYLDSKLPGGTDGIALGASSRVY